MYFLMYCLRVYQRINISDDFQACESGIHKKKKAEEKYLVVLSREFNLAKVSNCQLIFLYLAKLSFLKNQQRNKGISKQEQNKVIHDRQTRTAEHN